MKLSVLVHNHTPNFLKPLLERIECSPIAKRITTGVFWSILSYGVSKSLIFLAMILVARILGPKAFGEFGFVKSTAQTFVTFSLFGMGLTATKYIAELLPSDKDRLGRIIGLSYVFTCLSSLLVASAFWFAAPLICESGLQKPHLVGLLRLGAVLLFLMTFCMSQHGVLAGFQDFRGLAFSNIINSVIMVPIYVAGTYYWGLTGAVIGTVVAAALNAFINSVFIYRNTKRHAIRYRFLQAGRELSVLGRFSLPLVLKGVAWSTALWGCQMMLGWQQDGSAQLGIFYASMTIYAVIVAVPLACTRPYIAALSEIHGKGNIKLLQKIVFMSFSTNIATATVIALPFLLFPSPLMAWCFGEPFREGSGTLALVSLQAILYAVSGVVDQIMVSSGKCWTNCGCTITSAVTTLLVASWAIPTWGSFGLALALLLGGCTRIILFVPIGYRLSREWNRSLDVPFNSYSPPRVD